MIGGLTMGIWHSVITERQIKQHDEKIAQISLTHLTKYRLKPIYL
jgi:hypothetical protein